MKKIIILFLQLIFFISANAQPTLATDYQAFVTPVFPIRGDENWPLINQDQTPYSNYLYYLSKTEEFSIPATWLFRYDALNNSQITTTAKLTNNSHERGLFLEITPKLADLAEVTYPSGETWSDANRVFISGYSIENRIKILNALFSHFLKIFGHYPSSIGAWHIDAWTVNYLHQKYNIKSVVIVADQYSTDRYQLWGGWWGVPYYPSKNNILVPAQTTDYRIPVTVSHWAARDPDLGYGHGVHASTYSVQVNDYLLHNLNSEYYQTLLNTYTQNQNNQYGYLLIGIENDYNIDTYDQEITKQLTITKQAQDQNLIKITTLNKFSSWYKNNFPNLSPSHTITNSNNPDSINWQMSSDYRIAWQKNQNQYKILDYTIYNQNFSEPYLLTPNTHTHLHISLPHKIDSITFPDTTKQVSESEYQKLLKPIIPKLPFQTTITHIGLLYLIAITLLLVLLRKNLLLWFLLIAGSITINLPMIKSGLLYPYGMGFWGPNGHDGIWHISLIEHFSHHLNLNSPILAQTQLSNYHFLYDIILALINRLTPFTSIQLYFQIIPPLLALLLGFLTFKFTLIWNKSKLSAYIAVILTYFGGGFGWIVNLYQNKQLGGETIFWATQAISTLINPPYSISLIIILIGLILFSNYSKTKKPNNKILIITSIVLGILVHAKSYAAILFLSGLGFLSLSELFNFISRKNYQHIWKHKSTIINKLPKTKLLISSGIITALTLLPIIEINTTSSIFEYQPLWFTRNMLLFTDRLNWPELYNAIQAYWATNNYIKAILADGLAVGIFYIGNFGIRFIGLWFILRYFLPKTNYIFNKLKITNSIKFNNLNKQPDINHLLIFMFITACLIPLFFVQRGTPWNTIQFLYYAIFIANLFSAKVLDSWINKISHQSKKLKSIYSIITIIIIISLSIPTTLGTLPHYLPFRAPSRIPYEELTALEFLKQQEPGRVLTYPYDPDLASTYSVPKPLAYYESTAYVSALSSHPVYLEDQVNLEILNTDWQTAKQQAEQFFYTLNHQIAQEFINQQSIKYLYILKNQHPNISPEQLNFTKIFDNGLVYVYGK